ncbi:amino acid ABC transporter substrate-binding protein [Marinobacterium zhoushanense]|uniref:Amino acid ABC transporter substrate-binding protein n=1 Tax=Marinobacterium zhoushanense TaxID=1679163 RepID=A0ABQ1KFV6_9GAMM|nr:transporter substrate-binding domain-containing protein [Marinobacterium zhoushanense]GGB98867.1 amino acid ABC transporter substrate-binding protein [Marinobacterium zhoushanense]
MPHLFKAAARWLSLFCLCFSTLHVSANQLDDITQRGVLVVAVPQDFPPFGSVGPDLQPMGYDIDVAHYLADSLGLKLELVPVTSANRIPYLQTRKVDLVISSMGKNPEREKVVDFSRAYAPFFLGVFGESAANVNSATDLAGKTLGVTRGSVEDLEISKLAPESAVIHRFEDNNTTISAYLSGQVDLIATGNLVAATIAERSNNRELTSKFVIKNSPCFIGVRKGEAELLEKVNELITAGLASDKLDGLSLKWFKAKLPTDLK